MLFKTFSLLIFILILLTVRDFRSGMDTKLETGESWNNCIDGPQFLLLHNLVLWGDKVQEPGN